MPIRRVIALPPDVLDINNDDSRHAAYMVHRLTLSN
jgi:hypothetical protein